MIGDSHIALTHGLRGQGFNAFETPRAARPMRGVFAGASGFELDRSRAAFAAVAVMAGLPAGHPRRSAPLSVVRTD